MTALLGRFFQLCGMVILPVALYIGLADEKKIQLEVRLLFIGAFLFLLGWLLARERQP